MTGAVEPPKWPPSKGLRKDVEALLLISASAYLPANVSFGIHLRKDIVIVTVYRFDCDKLPRCLSHVNGKEQVVNQ